MLICDNSPGLSSSNADQGSGVSCRLLDFLSFLALWPRPKVSQY